MISSYWCKIVGVLFVGCSCAFAQYGGGGMGGGSTGGSYTPGSKSYGRGAAIGAAVGGVAGAGALFLLMHHHHNAVVGCVAPDGKTITADSGKHTYQLTGSPLTAGERVSVVGKKSKGPSGLDELDVQSVKKDFGQCQHVAAAGSSGQV